MREAERQITVQSQNRSSRYREKATRWAYVIDTLGEFPFVSPHRYSSEATARRAGERDLAALQAFEHSQV